MLQSHQINTVSRDSVHSVPHLLCLLFLWNGWPQCNAVRKQECLEALGMENGQISDGQISASTQYNASTAPVHGRLHFQKTGIQSGGWSAKTNDANQWLRIDLGNHTKVTRVATQGRNGHTQRVTKYKLEYSNDTGSFKTYRKEGSNNDKVFNGNTDPDTVVYHALLNPPIVARYIRFRPVSWSSHISMRVELYGCLQLQVQGSSSGISSHVMKAQADLCRSLRFAASLAGYALEGHVIKNISISAGMHDVCRDRCTMEGTCVSFNIGPKINDKVLCQLSDSDHTMYPDDLKLRAGFTYRGTENPCSSNPCFHNGTCLNGYTDKKYYCVCPSSAWGERCEQVARSCKELYDKNLSTGNKAYLLKLDSVELPVYCHMTNDLGSCGGGGWTLAMKIDGKKNTFHYDSTYWSNKTGHNLTDGQTGFDTHETKLPTYWSMSFSKICLGMKIGSQLIFIVMNQKASSLYSLIADGQYRNATVGRNTWKALVGVSATLQHYCDYEGFNSICSHSIGSRARIGIVNNDNDLCNTCDSRIGFGTGGYIDDTNTCGNVGPHSSDNGGKNTKAMGYILVQ